MIRRLRWWLVILVAGATLPACEASDVEASGDVVTETRTVAAFDAVRASNGARVVLTVDPASGDDSSLTVRADSNLVDFLTTRVSSGTLTVSVDRPAGVTSSAGFEVSGTVGTLTDVTADDGARVIVTATVSAASLSAANGASIDGTNLEAGTVDVEVRNGARVTVCATGVVTGEVSNGAALTVLCGGNAGGVDTSGGGTVTSR